MFRTRTVAAISAVAALAAALIGVGAGALLLDSRSSDTTTVVRDSAVAAPVAASRVGSVADVARKAGPAVVEITVSTGSSAFGGSAQAQGSGFVYDGRGYVVTNEHVVDQATSARVRFSDGKTYAATVVGTDASTDLAVLKIGASASELEPLQLADSSQLEVGEPVVAIGSPFGLEGTVTTGIVSALHREIVAPNEFTIADAIQTDAAINHGNSGGPLLDLDGRVIGVNAQIKSDSGGNDGVGFAIPSDTVRSIVRTIIDKGSVRHAYLGISLAGEGQARVDAVAPGTPAERAGLRAGDVITAVEGTAVRSASQLRGLIDTRHPGDTIELRVRRAGSDRTVTVKLGVRPD